MFAFPRNPITARDREVEFTSRLGEFIIRRVFAGIVLLLVVLLFGGAKLPQLARSLGRARREFEAGARGDGEVKDQEPPPAPDA